MDDPERLPRQRPKTETPPTTTSAVEEATASVDGPSSRHGHNRSSSLTSLKRTFSKILPANRSERGGTLRDSYELADARHAKEGGMEREEVGRRVRSWSPKKSETSGSSEHDEAGSRQDVERESERGGNAFQRFFRPRKTSTPNPLAHKETEEKRQTSQERPKGKRAIQFASPPTRMPPRISSTRRHDVSLIPSSPEAQVPLDSQQMFELKRARREQRRSYRSSDDYLTISGANPRTGYWDVNAPIASTSSSSEPTVVRQRELEIEENRRKLDAAKRELEDALSRRDQEVRERDQRKKERKIKREKKRDEVKRKERRNREAGRWRTEGEGWTMVIEPELSTIAQSVAGSSPKPDLSPDDQLTEMRIPSEVVEQGYFGQTSSRESSLRSKSPDVGIVHPRQSRLGVPQSRLPRQNPSIFAGPAPTTPVDRKSLPSPSRVVSGDIPLYTASPSASRKGGSSRNMSADPVPSPRAHDSPSAALERSNSARAAIFPTRRRQPQREPINGAALKTPRDLRSQVNYVATSDDRSKQMGRNASANEVVRRSPDRHDPFGPIPRRRPASPPKPTSVLQPAGLETHFSLGTGPFTGNEPIRKIDAEPTQLHDGRHPPGAVPSAVEVEPREVEGSNDTIVRHNIAESVPEVVPEAEKFHAPTATNKDLNSSPSQVDPEHRSFLGIRPEGHPEEPVTATSFQSVSTNPALTHRQSHQSPRDTDQARPIKSIASMGELPPFVVKDPLTGTSQPITPSSPKVLSEAANASFKEKILEANERDVSTITTTTITATTGYDPGPFQLEQVDGGNDSRRPVQRRPMPLSRIPAPRLSPQSARNHSPSGLAQRRQTEKDTSSIGAAAVTPTKRRIPRWYQRVLPGFGREAEKNTHTSTSTSPNQTPTSPRYHLGYPGGHPGAQSAARAALLNGGPAPSHSPRTSSQRAGIGAGAPGGSLGGGDSWKSRTGNPVRDGHGDSLVVWHSAPATPLRRLKHSPGGIEKKHVAGIRSPNSTKREQNTTGGATMQQVILVLLRTIRQLILTAWWYVEPVFDPRSAFRGRWERQELTWRDAMVIAGACLFVAGALLAAVVCGRVVVTAVQIGRLVGGTCRFLLGG